MVKRCRRGALQECRIRHRDSNRAETPRTRPRPAGAVIVAYASLGTRAADLLVRARLDVPGGHWAARDVRSRRGKQALEGSEPARFLGDSRVVSPGLGPSDRSGDDANRGRIVERWCGKMMPCTRDYSDSTRPCADHFPGSVRGEIPAPIPHPGPIHHGERNAFSPAIAPRRSRGAVECCAPMRNRWSRTWSRPWRASPRAASRR